MGIVDGVVAAAVLAAAIWLLFRSIRKAGVTGCHGCASGGCRKPPPADGELVRLGTGRRARW